MIGFDCGKYTGRKKTQQEQISPTANPSRRFAHHEGGEEGLFIWVFIFLFLAKP
jgi:hypothetical protein